MNTFSGSQLNVAPYHNYFVGGNVANAFCIGDVGNPGDFYIVGVEPPDESSYPLISANIFDSEGSRLLTIVNNTMQWNPQNCSKIKGDFLGYEIHDSAGRFIFKIETRYRKVLDLPDEYWITTIQGDFYDKNGKLVCRCSSGSPYDKVETGTKAAFGFHNTGFGLNGGYTPDEKPFLFHILSTRSKVNERMTGNFQNQQIVLDGKFIHDCSITNCEVILNEGDFFIAGTRFEFGGNKIRLSDKMNFLRQFFDAIRTNLGGPPPPTK